MFKVIKDEDQTLIQSFENFKDASKKMKEYFSNTGNIAYINDTSKKDGDIEKYTFLFFA
jgi:hypothetical protein